MKSNQSPLQRINRIMKFYYLRGQNRENVNEVFRKIIKLKLNKHSLIDISISNFCVFILL